MLSKAAQAAQAICVASLYLAATTTTTTTTEAFLFPSAAIGRAAVSRGHHQRQQHQRQEQPSSCARCSTLTSPAVLAAARAAAAMTMTMTMTTSGDVGNDNENRNRLSVLRSRIFSRNRSSSTGDIVDGVFSRRVRIQDKAQAAVRKTFLAVATALIVRASFSPQAASAVGYRPRTGGAPSSRQLRKKQEQEEKRMDRIREEVEKEQQQRLDAATSDLNGEIEISEEQAAAAAAAAAAATGEIGEQAGEATGEPAVAGAAVAEARTAARPTTEQLVERICALATPQEQELAMSELVPADYKKVWMKLTAAQKTAITRMRIENKTYKAVSIGDHRKMGNRDLAPLAIVFSSVLFFSGMRSSLKIMGKQRKRVKAEAAKFDMERDEFMNVEGEAEFDVDIMKELRDMKEKMAGPGDTYAKDTRAYNPEFAAKAGDEDEYDKKIQEALKGTGKGGKTSKGETRKIFTKDEPTNVDVNGDSEAPAADPTSQMSQADAEAQAKKAADAKRLEDLFKNSSIDDPEDEFGDGDKRELLP